jgi:hypothetical protein
MVIIVITTFLGSLLEVFINFFVVIFLLYAVTGNATTWGKWNPEYVNDFRGFSDERGLQSLQILAYLSAAINITNDDNNSNTYYRAAFNTLINHTNQYDYNMLNTKIQSPDYDNYSDDELAWLPYFIFMFTTPLQSSRYSIIKSSLLNSWHLIAKERSALWGSIYYSMMVKDDTTDLNKINIKNDILWNLQTWSDELIDWPNDNST